MKGGEGVRVKGFSSAEMTLKSPASSFSRSALAPRRVQQRHVIALQLAGVRVEVLAARDALAAERVQASLKLLAFAVAAGRGEARREVPVLRVHEAHARTLAVHDDLRGDALDPTGREARLDLAPEDGRDLVAIEAVEDASTLLGLDHVLVDLPGVLEGLKDRALGDLVEHHALVGDLEPEHLDEVPRDRLALTILIRRQQDAVDIGEHRLQLGDLLLLRRLDNVERLEVVLDVDAKPCPLLLLELGGDLRRVRREVTDVPDARLDDEVLTQELLEGLRLGGRLDDDEGLGHGWGEWSRASEPKAARGLGRGGAWRLYTRTWQAPLSTGGRGAPVDGGAGV